MKKDVILTANTFPYQAGVAGSIPTPATTRDEEPGAVRVFVFFRGACWNIPTCAMRCRALGKPCAICAYRREPRKLGRAANRAGAIGCGSSHLRLKADSHSLLRLSGCLIVSAFAGWSAPQPALRAFAARQVTKNRLRGSRNHTKDPRILP